MPTFKKRARDLRCIDKIVLNGKPVQIVGLQLIRDGGAVWITLETNAMLEYVLDEMIEVVVTP